MAAGGSVRIHCGGTAAPGQDAAGELSSGAGSSQLACRQAPCQAVSGVPGSGSTDLKCSCAHGEPLGCCCTLIWLRLAPAG